MKRLIPIWLVFAAILSGEALAQKDSPEERLDTRLKVLYRAHRRNSPRAIANALAIVNSRDQSPSKIGPSAVSSADLQVLVKFSGDPSRLANAGLRIQSRIGEVYAGVLAPEDVALLPELSGVEYVQLSHELRGWIEPALSVPSHSSALLPAATIRGAKARGGGKGVLVAFIDSGIDIWHEDFRHPDGTTRIKFLLDLSETGTDQSGGVVYTEEDINDALLGGREFPEKDVTGHGTHGMSIAAGDDSNYPSFAGRADLIVVKATRGDSLAFGESSVLKGLSFIDAKAEELGQPYVVNLSFATLDSSHDGRSLLEQAIDELFGTGKPGKVAVIAAGNHGRNCEPTAGRPSRCGSDATRFRHFQGQSFAGVEERYELKIPDYQPDPEQNDSVFVNLWHRAADRLQVSVISPSGHRVQVPTGFDAEEVTADGFVLIDHASGPHPLNGDALTRVEILETPESGPPAAGTWSITLEGIEIGATGVYHGWVGGVVGTEEPYFQTGDNRFLIGSPGSARNALTVGSYAANDGERFLTSWVDFQGNYWQPPDAQDGNISLFSSPGTTRDSRVKPEIVAPGEWVVGAVSRDAMPNAPGSSIYRNEYILNNEPSNAAFGVSSGTSFSAPVATGLAARILSIRPDLDAIEVRNVLVNSARTDEFTGKAPNPVWGFGKVNHRLGRWPILPRHLRIDAGELPVAYLHQPFEFVLTASGGTLPYAWSRARGRLPPGMVLEGNALRGVPTVAGDFTFRLRVVDQSKPRQANAKDFRLAVVERHPLAIETSYLPPARIGLSMNQQLEAQGGAPPYRWVISGSLPEGLSFSSSGVLSGTPVRLGEAHFTVQASDSEDVSIRKSFTVRVVSQAGLDWRPMGTDTIFVLGEKVAVDPDDPGHAFALFFIGLAETTNAGDLWLPLDIVDHIIASSARIYLEPGGRYLWLAAIAAGTLDKETLFKYDRLSRSWATMDLPACVLDLTPSLTLDFGGPDEIFVLGSVRDEDACVFHSSDGGNSWSVLPLGPDDDNIRLNLSVYRPNPDIFYIGTRLALIRTIDGGQTWQKLQSSPGGHAFVSQQDRLDVMVLVRDGGSVQQSLDGGITWAPVPIPPGSVDSMERSLSDPSALLVQTGLGFFWSQDAGESWLKLALRIQNVDLPISNATMAPSDPKTIYVTSWGQGVFLTQDGGESWTPKNDGLARHYPSGAFYNLGDPEDLFVLSIEKPYVSRNGGSRWVALEWPRIQEEDPELDFDVWGRLLTSFDDPNRYYLASSYTPVETDSSVSYFCRSDNRGVSWRCPSWPVYSFQVDPFDADHVLWFESVDNHSVLRRSTDGGQTATSLETPFRDGLKLALARDVRGRIFVYDLIMNSYFRSDDAGASWTEMGQPATGCESIVPHRILPAPSNSNYLYSYSVPTAIHDGSNDLQFFDPGIGRWQCSKTPLSTIRSLAVDPFDPRVAYTGGDGSAPPWPPEIYRTEDGGRTWSRVPQLEGVFIGSIDIDPRNSQVLLVAGSSGVHRSKDGGESWELLYNFSSVADVVNLNIQNPWNTQELFAATEGFGVQASLDGGRTYQFRSDGLTDVNVNVLAVAPWQPGVVFAGANTAMFKSEDSAQTWAPTALSGEVRDIAVDSDGTGRRLWAVVAGEGVAFSNDGGTSFTMTSAGLSSLDLTGIEVVQDGTGRRLWAVTRGGAGIHYYDETARRWVPAAGNGLTDRSLVDVESDGTGRRLWAVAETSVFFSDDRGVSWHAFSDGLPESAPLTSVSIDEMTGELFVSAFAGGVFRRALHDSAWTAFNDGLNDLRVNRVTQGEASAAHLRTLYAATSGSGLFSANVPTRGPVISTETLEDGIVGKSYSQALSAADGVAPFTWAAEDGRLPDGLLLDRQSGILSGAPTSRGEYHFVVSVEDAQGHRHSKAFTITMHRAASDAKG